MAFISLSANVIALILSETLLRTLNTPSGKEMSLHFDRSAKKKNMIMSVSTRQHALGSIRLLY